jgi:hypothetical protein
MEELIENEIQFSKYISNFELAKLIEKLILDFLLKIMKGELFAFFKKLGIILNLFQEDQTINCFIMKLFI